MAFIVGQAFGVFTRNPLTPNPPTQAMDDLLRGVGFAALELVGLTASDQNMLWHSASPSINPLLQRIRRPYVHDRGK